MSHNYKKILDSVRSPLGAFVLLGLITENILFLSIVKTPEDHQFLLSLAMVFVLILIVIGLIILTIKQVKKDEVIDFEKTVVNFNDVSAAISHIGDFINGESKENNRISIKNYALDLGLTIPWATTHFLNDREIENITYQALVIDSESSLIKKHIGNKKSTITINSSVSAIHKLKHFVERESKKLSSRNVTIEIKTYKHLPVLHGFLVNDRGLYFSFTKIHDDMVEIGNTPYFFVNRSSRNDERFFSVYDSWFDFYWKNGKTVFSFKDGEVHSLV